MKTKYEKSVISIDANATIITCGHCRSCFVMYAIIPNVGICSQQGNDSCVMYCYNCGKNLNEQK